MLVKLMLVDISTVSKLNYTSRVIAIAAFFFFSLFLSTTLRQQMLFEYLSWLPIPVVDIHFYTGTDNTRVRKAITKDRTTKLKMKVFSSITNIPPRPSAAKHFSSWTKRANIPCCHDDSVWPLAFEPNFPFRQSCTFPQIINETRQRRPPNRELICKSNPRMRDRLFSNVCSHFFSIHSLSTISSPQFFFNHDSLIEFCNSTVSRSSTISWRPFGRTEVFNRVSKGVTSTN